MFNWLRRSQRKVSAPRIRPRFVPVLEQLENRTPLAGNVTAVVCEGNLFVRGDNAGAAITISQPRAGQITLTGEDTTINGSAGPVTAGGVTGDLRICFGNGNDSLTFDQTKPITLAGNLSICGGRGSNTISTPFDAPEFLNVGGNLSILNLPGRTQLTTLLNLNVKGDVQIRNLGGAALVTIDIVPSEAPLPPSNTICGSLLIANGPGAVNQTNLSSINVKKDVRVLNQGDYALTRINAFAGEFSSALNTIGGDVQIVNACGRFGQMLISETIVKHDLKIVGCQCGPNAIFVQSCQVGGTTKLQGGNGDDMVFVGAAFGGAFHLHTGKGADAVFLEDATFGGACQLQTGQGGDTVCIGTGAARAVTLVATRFVPRLENGVTVYVLEFQTIQVSVAGGAATFHGKVLVHLGEDDDTLNLATGAKVQFNKDALLDGQAGNNTVNLRTANLPALPTLKRFQACHTL